jgi:hypothetical protein
MYPKRVVYQARLSTLHNRSEISQKKISSRLNALYMPPFLALLLTPASWLRPRLGFFAVSGT